MRCEAEQLKAEECDAADQLRSRQEEHQQKLLTAAANLHAVNLRAHFTALKHFVHDKMPAAMALWQGKAARDAAENDERTKSLEQVVFVAVPESDGPVFSSNWVQQTSLPVVPFLDLVRGVPQIADVLPKVRSSGGVVVIVVAGNAAEVSERIALESGVTKQLPEDAKLHRVFIRSSLEEASGIKYVGWVLIALLPVRDAPRDAPFSPLQERVLASQAVTQGCLLNLPGLMPNERVRPNSGHDLCPGPHPAKFHAALLQGCNIVSAFMTSGQIPMDFMLGQDETCTSSLARWVVDMAGAHMAGQPACGDYLAQVHLVTQARKWDDEARPSLNFRLHHLSEARAALLPHFEKRSLKRRKTDTCAQLEELAAGVPSAPPLPPKLAEALENVGASGFVRRRFLVASGKEFYDAGRAKLSRPDAPASTFENDAPPRLSLAVASTKANLLVAPSMLVLGASGLYSARAFAKGELLCQGSSMCNAWVPAEEKPAEPTCTLQLALRHQFFQTKDVRAQLVGDPFRNLWTAMNSTEGLSGASRVEPNVEAVFGDGGAVEMNNLFLAFKAARDIGAFEELVWRYEWANDDAVGQTAVEAPAAVPPSAAPQMPVAAAAFGPPALAAEGGNDANLDAEGGDDANLDALQAKGREIATGKAFTVYFYLGKIVVAFNKSVKRMPAFNVTVMSDKCRTTNAWKRVEYDLTPKSKVQIREGAEMTYRTTKLKDAVGNQIPHVWGYEAPDCKQRRLSSRDGDVKPLYWAPEPDDMDMCDALLDLGDCVEAVFAMAVQSIDDVIMLAPVGVTFFVKGRPVECELQESTTNTIILTPSSKKQADEVDDA